MPRHNLCPNPGVSVAVTGGTPETTWGGDATPTQVAVSRFPTGFAARYAGGTFIRTPRAVVAPGDTVSLGVSLQFPSAALNISGNTYITWYRANGSDLSFDTAGYITTVAAVLRVTRTGVAPAEAAFVGLIVDGPSFTAFPCDITALLIEAGGIANSYADGDSPGWGWDGTAGLSPSSESLDQSVTADSVGPTSQISDPTLTPGAVAVTVDGVGPTGQVGDPAVAPGAVTVTPTGIGPTGQIGDPTLTMVITPVGIGPTGQVGLPTVTPGAVTIAPAGIGPTGQVGPPIVNAGLQRSRSFELAYGPPRMDTWVFGSLELA